MPGIASAATSVVIAHIAGATARIRLGSGGIMLLNHSPLAVAEQFGTLESLYPGRIDLGLGRAPGTDQTTVRVLRGHADAGGDEFPQELEELRGYLENPAGKRVRAVPGGGLNIPIWLLGSGGFSAHLAGELGLPFASAGHFSPENMIPGIQVYRQSFRPSTGLDRPYVMIGINIFAADSDERAEGLASSHLRAQLQLALGSPIELPAPVKRLSDVFNDLSSSHPFLRSSIIGGPRAVGRKLRSLVEATGANEVMVHSMIYNHEDRRRSYEIVKKVGTLA
jgi:luciferase family oxidoreductase group 1